MCERLWSRVISRRSRRLSDRSSRRPSLPRRRPPRARCSSSTSTRHGWSGRLTHPASRRPATSRRRLRPLRERDGSGSRSPSRRACPFARGTPGPEASSGWSRSTDRPVPGRGRSSAAAWRQTFPSGEPLTLLVNLSLA